MRTAPKYYREGDERELVAPAYAYVFRHEAITYRWTSYERPLTIFNLPAMVDPDGVASFTPIQIKHGPLEHAADYQQKSFQISIATSNESITRFFVTGAATKVRITIIRLNGIALALAGTAQLDYATDGLIVGGGLLGETTMGGAVLTATVTPEIFFVDAQVPRYYFQTLCNHVLYDPMTCKAVKEGDNSIILSVDPWSKVIGIEFAPQENDYANGYMVHHATGGRFAIAWNSGSGVALAYWSPDLHVGDLVTLYEGCAHTTTDCQVKFNNLANFGGMPWVPEANPVYHGV